MNTHLSEEDHQKEFIIDTLFYFEGLVLTHISISRTERSRLNVRIMPSGIIFCSHAMECRVLLDGCPCRYVPSVFSGDETSFAALGTQEEKAMSLGTAFRYYRKAAIWSIIICKSNQRNLKCFIEHLDSNGYHHGII